MSEGGMSGVVVADSQICKIVEAGDGLYYRGYSITDLAAHCDFEEVVYLLLYGTLPKLDEFIAFQEELKNLRGIPKELKTLLAMIPADSNMMDVLRTAYSFMGSIYPEGQYSQEWICKKLIACCPTILCTWYHYHTSECHVPSESDDITLAEYFFKLFKLADTYTESQVRMLNLSLILYAEHEFNASTFTARVASSTNTDIYSAICAAIGALRGNLHGGANEAAIEFLLSFNDVNQVESTIINMIQNKEKIMGFGHRIYRAADPRSALIQESMMPMINTADLERLYQIALKVDGMMKTQKKLCTNVDYYTGLAYYAAGIPLNFYTPLFVMGRLAGWSAHIFEQRDSKKIIRPNANYSGSAPRQFVAMTDRD